MAKPQHKFGDEAAPQQPSRPSLVRGLYLTTLGFYAKAFDDSIFWVNQCTHRRRRYFKAIIKHNKIGRG
jgi:hypothetical protein